MRVMRTILSLCDFTGNWSRPYEDAGYEVLRFDLARGQDVRLLTRISQPIHGILAAPPCRHFSRAGARLWEEKGEAALLEGLSVVDACLRAVAIYRPVWWALENPIGRLKDYLGRPAFRFDPCDFGDPWTKRTWLWGHFTPPGPLISEQARRSLSKRVVCGAPGWSGKSAPSPLAAVQVDRTTHLSSRSIERSATPPGFARAFFESNP